MWSDFKEYIRLVAGRWWTMLIGILFALVGGGLDIAQTTGLILVNVPLNVGRILWVLALAVTSLSTPFMAFRKVKSERDALQRNVRITAYIGAMAVNYPDLGPDKVSLHVSVSWEVWTNQDIWTDRLALNLIDVYERKWWVPWRKTRFPKVGIPPKGQDSTQWRHPINTGSASLQPATFCTHFEWVGDRKRPDAHHFELELVLVTGIPIGTHRIPVDVIPLQGRGATPPL